MLANALNTSLYIDMTKLECLQSYEDPFASHSYLFVVVEDSPHRVNSSLLKYEFQGTGTTFNIVWQSVELICASAIIGPSEPGPFYFDNENPLCSNHDFSKGRLDH